MKISHKIPPDTVDQLGKICIHLAKHCKESSIEFSTNFEFFCWVENVKALGYKLEKRAFKSVGVEPIKIQMDHNTIYSLFMLSRTKAGGQVIDGIELYLQMVFNAYFQEAQKWLKPTLIKKELE